MYKNTSLYLYINWLGVDGCVGWMGAYYNFYKVIAQIEIAVEPRKMTWVFSNTESYFEILLRIALEQIERLTSQYHETKDLGGVGGGVWIPVWPENVPSNLEKGEVNIQVLDSMIFLLFQFAPFIFLKNVSL